MPCGHMIYCWSCLQDTHFCWLCSQRLTEKKSVCTKPETFFSFFVVIKTDTVSKAHNIKSYTNQADELHRHCTNDKPPQRGGAVPFPALGRVEMACRFPEGLILGRFSFGQRFSFFIPAVQCTVTCGQHS